MFLLVTSVFFLYFSSFMCVLHLSIPVSGSLNSFSAFSHYFFLALFAVLPADTCCLLLTPNIVTRMTSTRQIAVVKEITRKSGPRCASPTCITWNSCITCITFITCITCTTEISHQLISWDIIDIAFVPHWMHSAIILRTEIWKTTDESYIPGSVISCYYSSPPPSPNSPEKEGERWKDRV